MAAPSRPALERNAATEQSPPGPASGDPADPQETLAQSPSLARSERTDSLAAIAASIDSPRHTRPPLRSAMTSPPTSPGRAPRSLAPANAAHGAPAAAAGRANPPPRLSAASLTTVGSANSRQSNLSSGSGSLRSRESARASPASSSSNATTHASPHTPGGTHNHPRLDLSKDGFLVTSRSRPWAPPGGMTSPASPGPSTALMGANPFYGRSSPANSLNGSRQNSRESSRERASAVKREKREVDKLIRQYAGVGGPERERGRSTESLESAGFRGEGALGRRGSSPAVLPTEMRLAEEPKTTRTLSSSIDSKGRRMVNQYVRLKTIGQGSHGKVWLCAEPSAPLTDEPEEYEDEAGSPTLERNGSNRSNRSARQRRSPSQRWEDDIDAGKVQYCAIKSVAREGPRGARGQRSLRLAAQQRSKRPTTNSQGSGGIGADDKVKREVAIMKRLDHPNIVRLREVIDDAKSKKVFMVLEFMAGGQVVWQDENKQPTMTVDQARRTFRDVVLGLEYLHYQGIIHRDIKPANLLWTEDHSTVKISDFGVSHVSDALIRASPDKEPAVEGDDERALRKTAGSPAFFAPELCFPAEWSTTPGAVGSHHRDSMASTRSAIAHSPADAYFPIGMDGQDSPSGSTPTGSAHPKQTANGLPLSEVTISNPLPHLSSSKPRDRPPVGKGIDVWALGVTLYCLLFGDTPFMARTEYELYNVIVREAIRVPLVMCRERAWTGVGEPLAGGGDGAEGKEAIDLLGKLLEKDPTKRISLEEVKRHPWVLRGIPNPESWLRATDPARTHHVTITDEDVQHATQERGAVDTLPPIRNRPGIRRALNAALARFPAFSMMKSSRAAPNANSGGARAGERDPRNRSKSNSSAAHSIEPAAESSNSGVSRHPSDAGGAAFRIGKAKFSPEGSASAAAGGGGSSFGSELRRIISGGHSTAQESSYPGTSPNHGSRGGWGSNRRKLTPTNTLEPQSPPKAGSLFPELARSTSTSSVLQGASGRSGLSHGWFQRRPSDSDASGIKSPASSLPSPGMLHKASSNPSPFPGSETETSHVNGKGSGTLSRMLNRIAHGHASGHASSAATSTTGSLHSRSSMRERSDRDTPRQEGHSRGGLTSDGIDPAIVEQLEAAGTNRAQYDALGRLITKRKSSGNSRSSLQVNSRHTASRENVDDEDDDGPMIDLTEFEYSDSDDDDEDDDDYDDDDDLDELHDQPVAEGNYLSGWQPATFGDFRIGVRSPSDEIDVSRDFAEIVSPLTTPPVDEVGANNILEEDGKIGQDSTASASAASRPQTLAPPQPDAYIPSADTVSFQLCPIDFDIEAWTRPTRPKSEAVETRHQPTTSPASHQHQRLQQLSESVSARRDRGPLSIATALIPPSCERHDSTQSSQASQSPRDGSIRGLSLDTPGSETKTAPQWEDAADGEGEDDEEEMLVVPRRRRAATLNSSGGQGTPQR